MQVQKKVESNEKPKEAQAAFDGFTAPMNVQIKTKKGDK